MTEETNVFEEATISEELPMKDPEMEESAEEEEWAPTISKESPKEKSERKGVKKEMDGKTLTIKAIFHTKPKTKSFEGLPIEPKKTQDETKSYYPGKLGIRFEEENLVEYYPNFHYFVNEDGKMNTNAKINRNGNNAVSKIFKMVVLKLERPVDEISDQDVYDYMIGKKVTIKVESGTYLGKKWFRNDIIKIN